MYLLTAECLIRCICNYFCPIAICQLQISTVRVIPFIFCSSNCGTSAALIDERMLHADGSTKLGLRIVIDTADVCLWKCLYILPNLFSLISLI
jgi:hypothetical protein